MLKANLQSAGAKIASIFLLALAVMFSISAGAQSFAVLHNFTGGADGENPYAGLTIDNGGNLYGTAFAGGDGNGVVYKLTHRNGNWTLAPLYKFSGGDDGANPYAGVVFGPNGSLYGTTEYGGTGHGDGTVFNLRPPPHASPNVLGPWTKTVLYSFQGGTDGLEPWGGVAFDQAGNVYGTTAYGGQGCGGEGCGTVYQLTPSGGGWTEDVIYAFSNSDGLMPISGVTLDNAGNVYGTTLEGGASGAGTVYELTYSAGSGWAESFLYSFTPEGDNNPYAGLIFDPLGHLYGATAEEAGGVFKLTRLDGAWTYSTLYDDPLHEGPECLDWRACGPRADLVMDGAGDLYGTTYCDGAYGQGSVFKLTHINGG